MSDTPRHPGSSPPGGPRPVPPVGTPGETPGASGATPPGVTAPDASRDLDRELEAVERFIADVQAGRVGTSQAMVAYREIHRPAIERLRRELDGFLALLAEDQPPDAPTPPG